MLDAQTRTIVQDVLRGESRTLLQYACEAFPRFTPADRVELARLQGLADQELAAARTLAAWFVRRHGQVPMTERYPSWYTQINFISIPYLIPQLEKDHREEMARLSAAVVSLTDPEAHQLVEAILEQKEKSLAALGGASAPVPVTAGH